MTQSMEILGGSTDDEQPVLSSKTSKSKTLPNKNSGKNGKRSPSASLKALSSGMETNASAGFRGMSSVGRKMASILPWKGAPIFLQLPAAPPSGVLKSNRGSGTSLDSCEELGQPR